MKPVQLFREYLQKDNKNLFEIFNVKNLNIDWKNVSILDYGCNQGNYINSAQDFIDLSKYTGIDITQLSIDTARSLHPGINFVHYNKWHQAYNPLGNKTIKINDVFDQTFDVIICYSVFTHTTIEQTKSELEELKSILNPGGIILFTVWRKEMFKPYSKWISERFDNVALVDFELLHYDKMLYWLDTSAVVTDVFNFETTSYNSFDCYYNLEWLKEEISPATHLNIPANQNQDLFYLRKNNYV